MPEAARSDRVEDAVFAGAGEWARVVGRLKEEVGETAYRSWLRSMRLDRVEGGEGVIAVPTRFLRNWVATHYADRLLALWRAENDRIRLRAAILAPRMSIVAMVRRDFDTGRTVLVNGWVLSATEARRGKFQQGLVRTQSQQFAKAGS